MSRTEKESKEYFANVIRQQEKRISALERNRAFHMDEVERYRVLLEEAKWEKADIWAIFYSEYPGETLDEELEEWDTKFGRWNQERSELNGTILDGS